MLRALAFGKIERGVMLTTVIRGFRDGTIVFFLNMLLYQFINSEALVGLNAFLGGLAAILSAWLYGRLAPARQPEFLELRRHHRGHIGRIAAVLESGPAPAHRLQRGERPAGRLYPKPLGGRLPGLRPEPQRPPRQRRRGAHRPGVLSERWADRRHRGHYAAPQNPVGWVAAIVCLNLSQYLAAFFVRRTQRQLEALVPEPALQGWESIKRT